MSDSILSEPKAQRWRALAILSNKQEALLCLGQSIVQVRDGYLVPWYKYFPLETRKKVTSIEIQKWVGMADLGNWEPQALLPIPSFS